MLEMNILNETGTTIFSGLIQFFGRNTRVKQ